MPSWSLHPTLAKIGNEIVALLVERRWPRCHARPLRFPPSSVNIRMVAIKLLKGSSDDGKEFFRIAWKYHNAAPPSNCVKRSKRCESLKWGHRKLHLFLIS
jgi:hypothetical protein